MRLLLLLALMVIAAPAIAAPDPKAAAHYKQGKAFLDAKDFDRAITEFEAAYAIDKKSAHLYNIAKAYEGKSDWDKAIAYYQRFLDADPPPDVKRAAEVRESIVVATKARDEAIAKKKADDEAAAVLAAKAKLEQEVLQKKAAADSHVKNAEAFAQKGAWLDAGDEHRAAFEIDADPKHLSAAGDAYKKVPELGKARDAYRAYLDKVPTGVESDAVRGKLADVTKQIEDADAAKRARETAIRKPEPNPERPDRPAHKSFKRGWIVVGGALLLTGLVADLKAPNADNGKLDTTDFVGPALYGLGSIAVLRGVF